LEYTNSRKLNYHSDYTSDLVNAVLKKAGIEVSFGGIGSKYFVVTFKNRSNDRALSVYWPKKPSSVGGAFIIENGRQVFLPLYPPSPFVHGSLIYLSQQRPQGTVLRDFLTVWHQATIDMADSLLRQHFRIDSRLSPYLHLNGRFEQFISPGRTVFAGFILVGVTGSRRGTVMH